MRRMVTALIALSLVVGCAVAFSFVLTPVASAADAQPAAPAAPVAPAIPVAPAPPAAAPAAPAETIPGETAEDNDEDADGVIKILDAKARTMTVTYTEIDENDKEITKTLALKIVDDAKVSIDNDDAQLKDIRVGDRVLVTYTKSDKDVKNAKEVAVTRTKDAEGVFKSIDTAAKKIVITATDIDDNGKETKKDESYTLPQTVTVTIDGNDATLKDLQANDEIGISYLEDTPGQKVVKTIDITRSFAKPGKIKTLDIAGKKLVLTTTTEDADGKEVAKDETLTLGPDISVGVNNEEGKIDQLKVGDEVWVGYSQTPGGPMVVTQIEVDRTPATPNQ